MTLRNAKIYSQNYFCDDSNTKTFKISKDTIGYTKFEQLRKDRNAIIIDVRNHEVVATHGEIPNTINIQLPQIFNIFFGKGSDEFEEQCSVHFLKSSDLMIVFFKVENRAEKAPKLLTTGSEQKCYTSIASCKGSFDQWSENKLINIPRAKKAIHEKSHPRKVHSCLLAKYLELNIRKSS